MLLSDHQHVVAVQHGIQFSHIKSVSMFASDWIVCNLEQHSPMAHSQPFNISLPPSYYCSAFE